MTLRLRADNRRASRAILHRAMLTAQTARNRALYVATAVAFALLALASRRYASTLPAFVAEYAGDTLWATMVFFVVGAVATRRSTLQIAAIALAGSYAVELSQLYQAPWIVGIRRLWLGGLLLGYGFLWSDVVCYTLGVALGAAIEVASRWRVSRRAAAIA